MTNTMDNGKVLNGSKKKKLKKRPFFALRRTDDFEKNLGKIKQHLGLVNDSEVVRQVIKEKADSIN